MKMNHLPSVILMLHRRGQEAATRYQKAECEMLELIQEVDETKAFGYFECRSTLQYVVDEWRLTPDVAGTLVRVARKSKEVPALLESLKKQEIQLTKARVLCSVITPENQEQWLALAKTQSKANLERAVAKENPTFATPEKVKWVSENRVYLSFGMSSEDLDRLREVQDLESQRLRKSATLEESVNAAVQEYLKRRHPVEKAKRAQEQVEERKQKEQAAEPIPEEHPTEKDETQVPGRKVSKKREKIPAPLKHAIDLRDRRQCRALDPRTKQRCTQKRWLDYHHIVSVRVGGENTLENLITLCRYCHVRIHEKQDRGT